ncbi:hypothetical protein Pcinc_005607 [Petrolisthes cinctipes]|uniref:C3H1-type domain-containing protein n=1 Tax=Petrolisthes cinctipes TaxID=88211 RepID=A0AAE1GEK8_PETCI|nr:hypothetical protein Pcinc_005607 [Petrolisthes cinctipes]
MEEVKEEKEEGELEEGELEDEEGDEEPSTNPPPHPSPVEKTGDSAVGRRKSGGENTSHETGGTELQAKDEAKKERRESKESKEEKKRKHRDDDEEREKRKKKKKKKKHISSEEEENEGPGEKYLHRKLIAPSFDSNMGFDAMLQQEMILRGRSPPPGMMPYGPPPPGAFGGPPPMFRGRPVSDYDSFESGSESEMRERHMRRPRRPTRRFRRSRSRSRSPSRKNEAICMYYMQGSCQRGKGCPYSHDIQPQRKMELCKFYLMDCCAKKDKCLYMHKDFPCKNYHTGVKCKSVDKCKFSHDPLSDAARSVLLKHIELAPKDILGDFPRLTKEAAHLVVTVTEAHRRGSPIDVDNVPGILEVKGRGFKYVEKAIKNLAKRQEAKIKNMQEKSENYDGGMGGERRMSEQYQHQHHHHQPHQHQGSGKPHYHCMDEGPPRSPPPTPPITNMQQPHGEEMYDGELGSGISNSGMSPCGPSPGNNPVGVSPIHNTNRKQISFMPMSARMPQKQRELFQRIEQQHSLHADQESMGGEGMTEDAPAATATGAATTPVGSPTNVNWYSSDDDADTTAPSRMHSHEGRMSPSRTPPMPSHSSGDSTLTPSGHLTGGGQGGGIPPSTPPQKGSFPGINLDSINISSDLASVLSALKNQNAASNNRTSSTEEQGRDPRMLSPRGKDLRDPTSEPRNLPGDSHDITRDGMQQQSPRSHADYPPQSPLWSRDPGPVSRMRDPWDHQSNIDIPKNVRDHHSGFSDSRGLTEFDRDHNQRTKDIDLRVLPGTENRRTQSSSIKGQQYDTDMRMSSESSIYDVDLRQLNLPSTFQSNEEDVNSLPFKVPLHTPAKEICASISSHSPIYYQLIKITIPKPNFTHLKLNKDDPRVVDDPRLRRMFRRSSTEDSSNRSPRAPSRYELDGPLSPPTLPPAKTETKSADSDSRDPRMSGLRDPRSEPRSDPRGEPRGDPRMNTRGDPRVNNRGDPRGDIRDPRGEQMPDMRNQNPRMSGMFVGGNSGGMMDGGMQYMNMGPGGMGPDGGMGPGPGPGHGMGPGPGPGHGMGPGHGHGMGPGPGPGHGMGPGPGHGMGPGPGHGMGPGPGPGHGMGPGPGGPGPGHGMGPGPGSGPGPMGSMMPPNMNPRDKPGLLGPAPLGPFSSGFNPNMGPSPGMGPFMMGPNGGFYPEDGGGDEMMGGEFNQGGPSWGGDGGGQMPANDPRLSREMGEGNRSYTPPPIS